MDITRSGRPPNSAIERSTLARQLQDTQKDIDRCQSELDRLRELTEALETQKQLLLAHCDRIHSIIASPIRTLPRELLVEIFSYLCLPEFSTFISNVAAKSILPVLVISQVCIGWHKPVNGTPALWSSFSINLWRCKQAPVEVSIQKLLLHNSGSHPIDFNFYSASSDVVAMISTRAVSDRWRRVYFSNVDSPLAEMLFGPPSLEPVLSPPTRDLPELVSLELHSSEDRSYPLPNCPKLGSLTLSRLHLYRQPSSQGG